MIQGKASLLSNLQKLKYSIIHIIKYKRNSECVTSSAISFAYPPCCAYNCFVEIGETLKCHNFLILHPILMKFSALCLFNFTLFIEINLILVWTLPLKAFSGRSWGVPHAIFIFQVYMYVKWVTDLDSWKKNLSIKIH